MKAAANEDLTQQSTQAQISFLQGEREGHQNMMQSLVKRIKMLENSLRQER